MPQLPNLPPKPQASLPPLPPKPKPDLLPARPQVPFPPPLETEQEKEAKKKKGLGSPPPPSNPKKREEILARLEKAAASNKDSQNSAISPTSASPTSISHSRNGSDFNDRREGSTSRDGYPSTSSSTTSQDYERSRTPSNGPISRSGANGIELPKGNGWGDRTLPPSGPAADRNRGLNHYSNHQSSSSSVHHQRDGQSQEYWQDRNGYGKGKERAPSHTHQSPDHQRSTNSSSSSSSQHYHQHQSSSHQPPPSSSSHSNGSLHPHSNGYPSSNTNGIHSSQPPPPPPPSTSSVAPPPPPPPSSSPPSKPTSTPKSTALPLGPKSWFKEAKLNPETPPPPPIAKKPEPLPPPPPVSFGHVPLPNELPLPTKKHERDWRCTYDPHLDKSGSSKGKEVVRRYRENDDHLLKKEDPRKSLPDGGRSTTYGRKIARYQLDRIKYEWDSNSTGPRPPPPPRGLLVTGASPLTTQQALLQHFRAFGRVAESELKTDPQTGQSLGIFWLKFAHDYDEDGNRLADAMDYQYEKIDHQRGDVCARRALESTNGTKVGINVVAVELDGDRKKYVRTYRLELGKRYPPRKKASSSSSSSSTSKPSQPPPPPPPPKEAAPPPPPPPPAPSMYPSHHPLSGVGSQSRVMPSQPAISSPLAASRGQQASFPPVGAPTGPRGAGSAPGMPPPNVPTGPRGARSVRGRGGFRGYQAPQPPGGWNAYSHQASIQPPVYEAMPSFTTPQTPSDSLQQHQASSQSPVTPTSASIVKTPSQNTPSSSSSQDVAMRARSESISAASPLASSHGAASPSTTSSRVVAEPASAVSTSKVEKKEEISSNEKEKEKGKETEKEETEAGDSAEESDNMDMGSDDEDDFTGKTPLAQIQNSQVFYGRRGGRGGRAVAGVAPDKFEETSAIMEELDMVGMPYVFVARTASMSSQINTIAIRRHFGCFLPLWVRSDSQGWYVAFNSKDAANRCKMVLDKANLSGFQISIDVKPPPSGVIDRKPALATSSRQSQVRQSSKYVKKKPKITWTDEELAEEARDIILKELGDVFLRDLKNRVVNPLVSEFLSPSGEGGKFLDNPPADLITPKAQRWHRHNRDEDEEMEEGDFGDEDVKDESQASNLAGGSALPSFKKRQVKPPPTKDDNLKKDKSGRWSLAPQSEPQAPGPAPGPPPLSAQEKQRRMGDEIIAAAYAKIQERKAQLQAAQAQQAGTKPVESVEEMRKEMENDEELQKQVVAEADAQAGILVEEEVQAPVTKKKGGKKAAGKGKKGKKSEIEIESESITPQIDTPMNVIDDGIPASEKVLLEQLKQVETNRPAPIKSSRPRSPTPDPFELGIAETDEDLYYVQIALERMCAGEPVVPEGAGDSAGLESGLAPSAAGANGTTSSSGQGFGFDLQLHSSGSARTQGFYRIPPSQKAAHLPDRNKATVDGSTVSTHALASARNNRADSRKVLLGIEQHKKDTATDTDILKFNQLGSRKKQLRFSKSPIHDWGLYAMELIPAGDMVIEYVGEVVRQQVADNREKQYERQGNFSTYLFRVDDDLVVDATHKGNIARLMNHCCTPNATAKILTLNGEKRIVIYAKSTILPGQELTYDYKFQSTGQEEDAIACLCGSPNCRKWL